MYVDQLNEHLKEFLNLILKKHKPIHNISNYLRKNFINYYFVNTSLKYLFSHKETVSESVNSYFLSRPKCRKPKVPQNYNFVQNCRIRLDELNRTIPGRSICDNSIRSYSSTVPCACDTLGCTPYFLWYHSIYSRSQSSESAVPCQLEE